jgi:hypothetical protein
MWRLIPCTHLRCGCVFVCLFAAGTNAVILLVDSSRRATFEYAQRELALIPKDIDVLLLVPPPAPHPFPLRR